MVLLGSTTLVRVGLGKPLCKHKPHWKLKEREEPVTPRAVGQKMIVTARNGVNEGHSDRNAVSMIGERGKSQELRGKKYSLLS